MKLIKLLLIGLSVIVLSSCGGTSNGNGETNSKKFAPKDRTTSSMSDEERAAAIAKKKAEKSVDICAMMTSNNVKLSVMPPAPIGDFNEDLSEKIAVKMLQMISQNGIGGLNTVPGFALTATLTEGEKKTTGTAPQKMVVQYTLNFAVINTVTGDVYATATQEITGVGDSFQQATSNATKEIKNTPAMQEMLSIASDKIISWFNDNLESFKGQVEAACEKKDYALAISLIESVPQKATEAFKYAQSRRNDVNSKFMNSIAAQELTDLKAAIQASGNIPSAEVYAHMKLLPSDSPQYKEAEKLLNNYEAAIKAKCADEERKAELDAQRAHETELANIEAERLKAKYQAKATEQALRQHMRDKDDKNRGFWGSLGARIIGAIDGVTDGGDDDEK